MVHCYYYNFPLRFYRVLFYINSFIKLLGVVGFFWFLDVRFMYL